MPPEYDLLRSQIINEVFQRIQYQHFFHPGTSHELLYSVLHMWPVYQQDDIGRRVVAIYDNPSSAQRLQELIDHHGFKMEPVIQHAPSGNRLKEIFGGKIE